MIPASYNLNIYRGDTDRRTFKLWTDTARTQPADLTGVTVAAMIRDKAVGGVYQQAIACVVTLPNIIDTVLTPTQTRNLPAVGVWDMQLTYFSGDIATVLKGSAIVTQDVTYTGTATTTPPATQLARVK